MIYRITATWLVGTLLFTGFTSRANTQSADVRKWRERALEIMTSDPDSSFLLANLLYQNDGSQSDKDYARFLSGQYFYKKGQYDTSYYLLDDVREKFGETLEKGMALSTLGRIFNRQENFAYAEKFHQQALSVFKKIDVPLRQFFTLNDLGIVHYSTGDYTRALEYYLQAMDLAYDANYENRLVRLMSNIVGVYTMLNQHDKALELAQQALTLSQKTTDPVDKKTALTALGYAHKKVGNIDSAVYYNELALELMREAGDFFSQSWQLIDIGDLYLLKKNYKAGLEAYRKALSFVKEQNYQEDLDVVMIQIAETFLLLDQPDSALHYALQANHYAVENQLKWSVQKSAEILAQLYAKKQDLNHATLFYATALAYKDSIYNDKNQKLFADQRVKLETMEKVKEIELLKSEAKIAEIKRQATARNSFFGITALTLLLVSIIIYYINRQKIQRLKAEKLTRELERNQKDLSLQTIRMIRINNNITELETNLKTLKQKYNGASHEVQKTLSKIQLHKSLEKEWEHFNQFFLNAHPQFIQKLKDNYPNLSLNEIRLSSLMKQNLSNAEIASIMNIEVKSVRMSKYRLKKRMNLSEETDIHEFIHAL